MSIFTTAKTSSHDSQPFPVSPQAAEETQTLADLLQVYTALVDGEPLGGKTAQDVLAWVKGIRETSPSFSTVKSCAATIEILVEEAIEHGA